MKTIQRIGSKERPGEFNVLALLEDGEREPAPGDEVALEGLGACRVLQGRPNTYGLPGIEPQHHVVILDVVRTAIGPDLSDQSYAISVLAAAPSTTPTTPPSPASGASGAEPSDAAMDLTWTGLEQGIASVRDGGPLVPFVIVERDGERKLSRFLAGSPDRMDLEGSVQQAVAFASTTAAESSNRLVLVYDAYLRMGDDRFDAIHAEGVEAGSVAIVLAQRYRPKGRFRGFESIGNAQSLPLTMCHLGGAG
jgi:hypothetical protein